VGGCFAVVCIAGRLEAVEIYARERARDRGA
jgi:hypothetical protein